MQTRKSENLTPRELKAIKAALTGYGSKAEVCRKTGISRQTLCNVIASGTGLFENVSALRSFFKLPSL